MPAAEGGRALRDALFRSTPRAGRGDPGWACGEALHRASASAVRWHWRVVDGVIAEARYEVRGCPDLIAVTELAAGALVGQPAAAPELSLRALAASLEVPVGKLGTLLVIEDAVRATAIQFGVAGP